MRLQESGASEDLNYTIVEWPAGKGVAEHVNGEVDVVMVVVSGSGEVVVDGERYEVRSGDALLIPKAARRAVSSRSDDFRYLNIHRRRRGIVLGAMRRN